jgi:hypothetical protein
LFSAGDQRQYFSALTRCFDSEKGLALTREHGKNLPIDFKGAVSQD